MITKQQLIENFQILVEKRNDLFKEVKDLECLGEYKQVIDREMELIDIEKYLKIFKKEKKAYVGECCNLILRQINYLKSIKENLVRTRR